MGATTNNELHVDRGRIFAWMVFFASFPLIWYALAKWLLLKKIVLAFWSHPRGQGRVWGQNIWQHFVVGFIPFIWYAAWPYVHSLKMIRNLAMAQLPKSKQGTESSQGLETKILQDKFHIYHGWQSVECETGGSAKTYGRLISGFAKRIRKRLTNNECSRLKAVYLN